MAIICDGCDGTCIIFDWETKIPTGMQQKQGGESALSSNLAGKHIFLAGHPFTLAGWRFSGVATGGGVLEHRFGSFLDTCLRVGGSSPARVAKLCNSRLKE